MGSSGAVCRPQLILCRFESKLESGKAHMSSDRSRYGMFYIRLTLKAPMTLNERSVVKSNITSEFLDHDFLYDGNTYCLRAIIKQIWHVLYKIDLGSHR